MMTCSICGGDLAELGTLGNLVWMRCVNCGMECSRPAEDLDDYLEALIGDAAEASERFGDDECERYAAEIRRRS